MGKFATGLIAGGIIGAMGGAWMFSDARTKRRVQRDSRRMAEAAGDVVNDVTAAME